jgi:hypothetical protein
MTYGPHFPNANPTPDEGCFSCMENELGEWNEPEWFRCEPCAEAYEDYLVDMADRRAEEAWGR